MEAQEKKPLWRRREFWATGSGATILLAMAVFLRVTATEKKSHVLSNAKDGIIAAINAPDSGNKDLDAALTNYIDVMKAKDYQRAAAFMPPDFVKGMGGVEEASKMMKQLMSAMDIHGLITSNINIHKIDSTPDNQEFFASIETDMVATIRGKKLKIQDQMIGLSMNGGKTWYFLVSRPRTGVTNQAAFRDRSRSGSASSPSSAGVVV